KSTCSKQKGLEKEYLSDVRIMNGKVPKCYNRKINCKKGPVFGNHYENKIGA
ncbi:3725_t:CDS:1, partial [Gigaspora margarita]